MALVPGRSQYNWEHGIPCRNPSCKSYMKPGGHPNCECSSAGIQTGKSGGSGPAGPTKRVTDMYASGGEVHCSQDRPHNENCQFFASGGEIKQIQEFHQNPSLAVSHAIAHHGLLHVLTKAGKSRSENPDKPMEDFQEAARHGKKAIESHSKAIFDDSHEDVEPDEESVKALRDHIEALRQNPSALLNVGGNLSPDHSGALGAKAAEVFNYFNSMRPGISATWTAQ